MDSPAVTVEVSGVSPSSSLAPVLESKDKDNKDDEGEGSNRPPRSPSPDVRHCSICLQDLVNKSYSNTCCHEFCFGCLLEWSKVKPECPLCKASFRSIYHNIRSNDDYDEYVVPTPLPHLSIRLTTSDRFSPEVIVTSRGSSNLGNHDYSLPDFRIGASIGRSRNSREVAHAIMRDRLRDPRVIRIFQYAASGEGSMSRAEAIDVTLQGPALPADNPFHSDTPELFGSSIELANASFSSGGSQFSGYQGRRRRYDRNQWVSPFDTTLQPGTVFFPSVEYFQRHPSAIRRISPWLHRELTVLLSLTRSRPQMAFIYDLIISLLSRYDIRSREFRELLRTYFGSKTKHFQHEFYHYVLSGMRMEEYDGIARYGSTSSTAVPSSSNFEDNPASREPPIVTLESEDENNDEVEIVLSGDEDIGLNSNRDRGTDDLINQAMRGGTGDDWLEELIQHIPHLSSPFTSPTPPTYPADLSDSLEPFNPVEIAQNRHRSSSGRGSHFDPEMPILEPQVDLNNLSSTAGTTGSAFRRTRRSLPTEPSTTTNSSNTTTTTIAAAASAARSRASSTIGLLNSLREIYMHPERHSVNEMRFPSSNNNHRDPVDGRRSPYPQPQPSIFSSGGDSSNAVARPLASPDFPVLDYQRRRRDREQEQHMPFSNAENNDVDGRMDDAYHTRLRSYRMRMNGASSIVPENNSYSVPERSSCIHNPATSSSGHFSMFPTPMDLSKHTSSYACGSSNHNQSVIQSRPRTPNRPPSPFDCNPYTNQRDDGECEFLGVHAVVKKPPLAVITLSSDDEDERRCKNERLDALQADPVEQDVFMELFNATFESDMPVTSLSAENSIDSRIPTTSRSTCPYQTPEPYSLPFPYNTSKSSLRRPRLSSSAASQSIYSNILREAFSPPQNISTLSSSSAASFVADPPEQSVSSPKKRSKRARDERDSRKSRSDTRKSKPEVDNFEVEQSNKLKTVVKRRVVKRKTTSKSRSPSAKSTSSSESDCDYELRTKQRKSSKTPKKKKSKKSKRSKSSLNPHKKTPEQVTRSSSLAGTASTSSSAINNPKVKSVVVKVDKPHHNKRKKSAKSRVLIYTSSDDSSSEDNHLPSVSLSFSKINKDCKRLRSVIASTSGSLTSSPMTVSNSDANTAAAAAAALDLRSSSHSHSRSSEATLPAQTASKRWESDDDEHKIDGDDTSHETETLLSVGYEDNSRSTGDSDTDNPDSSSKIATLWGINRKRLTSGGENSMTFMNPGTSSPSALISTSPEPIDRFIDNSLISHDVEVVSNSSSSELRSLSPAFPESHGHRHHFDVDISYPERRSVDDEDLLDLTVTVTRSGSSSPSTSPVPPVHLWW